MVVHFPKLYLLKLQVKNSKAEQEVAETSNVYEGELASPAPKIYEKANCVTG